MARRCPRRPGGTLKDSERRQLAYASRRAAAATAAELAPPTPTGAVHRVLCDGGSRGNPGTAASAAVLFAPGGERIAEHAEEIGRATAGEAEYRAIALGLELAARHGVSAVEICCDSQIAVAAAVRGDAPAPIAVAAGALATVTFRWLPRAENDAADALVRALLW
jgi:ribonuclease HI